GEINGICCYTFAHIDHMEWDLNKGIIHVQITSLTDQTLKLHYRHHDFNIVIQGVSHKAQENSYEISLKKDETVFVKILIQK
ncbi:MAG TPA: hypothetical protein GX707_02955, partial [Epulopiscium sp.]|nr:hypothetical protein [Candidatus Epulonipiscium sp.]